MTEAETKLKAQVKELASQLGISEEEAQKLLKGGEPVPLPIQSWCRIEPKTDN